MTKEYNKALFIFRRDLRLSDNTGLLEACRQSERVIAAFFLDPRQVDKNPYKSIHAIQFMYNSLVELDQEIKEKSGRLQVWEGSPEKLLAEIIAEEKLEAIFFNKDYTPFSLERDAAIQKEAEKYGCVVKSFDDALINAPGTVLKGDGTPYTVYTPFAKTAKKIPVAEPVQFRFQDSFLASSKSGKLITTIKLVESPSDTLLLYGGRTEAKKLLDKACTLDNYKEERDFPAISGTSTLSSHHKFGTISIREAYHQIKTHLGEDHTMISELYWRDFFSHVSFHFPHVYKQNFYKQYDAIKWENDKSKFKAWCEGKTGFPIVDAGMRELNETGYMHNRVRMVVASFLTKDLHIDWRWGEKYFAQKLLDYDPAVNNGNWQWAASTGCDAQPYFRIFNPWRQQERFDPDCIYIKKWVPELESIPAKALHKLAESDSHPKSYVKPIVDHRDAKETAEDMYIAAREKAKN